MTRYEKIGWRFSIFYTIIMILDALFASFAIKKTSAPYLPFMTQLCAFVVFYLAFKKQQKIFSLISLGWLLYGMSKGLYNISTLILPHVGQDGFMAVLLGAMVALLTMMTFTYFTLRVFLHQLKNKTCQLN